MVKVLPKTKKHLLKVNKLKEEEGFVPILATILVGEDPASAIRKNEGNTCEE